MSGGGVGKKVQIHVTHINNTHHSTPGPPTVNTHRSYDHLQTKINQENTSGCYGDDTPKHIQSRNPTLPPAPELEVLT